MAEAKLPSVGKLTALGILLIVFGLICLLAPMVAGGAITYLIGFVLLAAGLYQLFQGFREESLASKLLPIILGVITIIAGGAILARPVMGMAVLTVVLAISFIFEGIWKIAASFSYRPAAGWFGLLLSGILAVIIGGLIWIEWPSSALWAIGVLVGVNLLATGVALVFLASTVRELGRRYREAAGPAVAATGSAE